MNNALLVNNDDVKVNRTREEIITKAARTIRTRNYQAKAANQIASLEPCPRWADDVYTLGMIVQDYICDIYLDLEAVCQDDQKAEYSELVIAQTAIRDEILRLANINLSKILHDYYTHGGLVMEPPVSEKMTQEAQPFFHRIASNFFNELDIIVNIASKGNVDPIDVNNAVDNYTNAMYSTMSKLFQPKEIQVAFDNLMTARHTGI